MLACVFACLSLETLTGPPESLVQTKHLIPKELKKSERKEKGSRVASFFFFSFFLTSVRSFVRSFVRRRVCR